MDLVILEKIEYSILNDLEYIVRLEKKSGNKEKISELVQYRKNYENYYGKEVER